MARPADARTGIVAAREAFTAGYNGGTLDIRKGDLFEASHPFVKAHPELFTEARVHWSAPHVEQATAAPGEKRG